MFKENFRFVSKITLIHLLTYTACGITFSIEEFIYYEPSNIAWNLQLGGLAEILIQTLLFSFLSMRVIKHSSSK